MAQFLRFEFKFVIFSIPFLRRVLTSVTLLLRSVLQAGNIDLRKATLRALIGCNVCRSFYSTSVFSRCDLFVAIENNLEEMLICKYRRHLSPFPLNLNNCEA